MFYVQRAICSELVILSTLWLLGATAAAEPIPDIFFYQAAYTEFTRGNYGAAILGFMEFIERFPNDELAAEAQYWSGEANLRIARDRAAQGEPATRFYEWAVQDFRRVVINYPKSDKVPRALYEEALALLELKQQALAVARLQYIVDQFPRTEEATLARDRLAAFREGGAVPQGHVWVLWRHVLVPVSGKGMSAQQLSIALGAWPSREECERARFAEQQAREKAAATSGSLGAVRDACLPDTVDPRQR